MAEKWCRQLTVLSELAQTQPHAAYTAFTKGLCARWKFHIRATDCPPEIFNTLDTILNEELLPALTGRAAPASSAERILLSLPSSLGGLAVPVVSGYAEHEHLCSKRVTEPLVAIVTSPSEKLAGPPISAESSDCHSAIDSSSQSLLEMPRHPAPDPQPDQFDDVALLPNPPLAPVMVAVAACRGLLQKERASRRTAHREVVKSLLPKITQRQQCLLSIASEKGISSWLTAEPSLSSGTVLNKSDFRDAVCLRYGFPLDGLPTACVCGKDMTVDHALTCPCGGYPMARHDEIRDVLAEALSSICPDVETEPQLLPFEDETLPGKTANRSPEARLDIRARGFWTRQQEAFFDIRVTHPKAHLLTVADAKKQLAGNEREKKRQYGQRVNVVERGEFTPLVFSTAGMVGEECSRFLKALVVEITRKNLDLT